MQFASKTVAAVACAGLLATGSAAVADSACARAPHPRSHVTKQHDKLAGPRKAATHAISAQLKAVQTLVKRAAVLTSAHAADLQTALAADLAAIRQSLGGVAGATSVKALGTLRTAAETARQVARTQYGTVVAADAAAMQAAGLDEQVTALQAQLDALAAGGADTTEAQAALDAIVQTLSAAVDQLGKLTDDALALLPAATRADRHAVGEAADVAFSEIADTLGSVLADLTAFPGTYGL